MINPGYIYCAQLFGAGESLLKIGHSYNPKYRLRNIRHVLPFHIEIVATFIGTRPYEGALHRYLAPSRKQGEWYYGTNLLWDFVASGEFTGDFNNAIKLERITLS